MISGDRIRLLHLRSLRDQLGRTILVVFSIAVSAAVLVGVLSVPNSIQEAAGHAADLLPHGSLVVLAPSDSGMDLGVVQEIRTVPGVHVAAPIIRSNVLVDDIQATVLGVDSSSQRTGSPVTPERCGFAAVDIAGRAVVGPGLHRPPGSLLSVRAGDGHRTTVRVAAVSKCAVLADFNAGRVVLTDLRTAQILTDRADRVDLVSVTTNRPSDGVARSLSEMFRGRASVQDPSVAVGQAKDAVAPLAQGINVVAGVAAVVAGFVVFSAMSTAAAERRRHFAVLRAIGMRARAARFGILTEALIVGLVGSVIGSVAGVPLGSILLSRAPQLVVEAVGYEPVFHLSPVLVPGVVAAVTLVTVLAASGPSRQVADVPPLEAMRSPDLTSGPGAGFGSYRMLLAGLVATAGAVLSLRFLAGPSSYLSFVLAFVAAVLLVLAASGPLSSVASWVADRGGTAGRLAALDLTRSRHRTIGLLVAVMVAVSTLVGFHGLVDNIQSTYTARLSSLGASDLVVQAGPSDQVPLDFRVSDGTIRSIAAIRGVRSVQVVSLLLLNMGDRVVQVDGVGPGAPDPAIRGVPKSAIEAMHRGEGVIVNSTFARQQGATVGGSVEFPVPGGPQRLRVLAIGQYYTLTPGGVLAIDESLVRSWYQRSGVSVAYVWIAHHSANSNVAANVRHVVRLRQGRSASVVTGRQYVAGLSRQVRAIPSLLNAILVATVIAAVLAVINSVTTGIVVRRREFAVLRAMGTRRSVVIGSVIVGAAAAGIVGGVLGVLLGLILQPIDVHNVSELAAGAMINYQFDVSAIAIGFAGIVLIVAVGMLIPIRRALDGDIYLSLRESVD